jgi:hypothetical protein
MTWCGMLGVRGGLFAAMPFVFMGVSFAVTSSGFILAVVALVAGFFAVVFFAVGFFAAGFAVVFFATGFFAAGFFVIFAMIGLLVFSAEQLSAFLHSSFLYFYADDAIKRIRGYYAHEGIDGDSGCV